MKPKFGFFSNRIYEAAIQVPKGRQGKATTAAILVFPSEKLAGMLEYVYYGKGHP